MAALTEVDATDALYGDTFDESDPAQCMLEYLKCQADPAYFISRYVLIRDAQRGTIPFALWPWQAQLLYTWQHERLCIILKARQLGVSELAQAYALWLVRFYGGKSVLIISKGEDAAVKLLNRTKFSYNHLPAWLHAIDSERDPEALAALNPPQADPGIDQSYLGKINSTTFEVNHLDSHQQYSTSWITSLPATESAGRSESASLVILDEWAFQQFHKSIWAAVSPTIATGGQLIGMSTANGPSNTFAKIWSAATKGDNTFKPVFLNWRHYPGRDDAWYARESVNHEPWEMRQEYPSTPAEAFRQSGSPVFDQSYLIEASQYLDQEIAAGLRPVESADGLTVWEDAQPGHTYVIAADVASGLADGDYDAAVVLDRATWAQCAELRGRWPPDIYAEKLWDLGLRFNVAEIAPEYINYGQTVLLRLTQPAHAHRVVHADGTITNYPATQGYPRVYHRVDELVPGTRPSLRPGWDTNVKTKPRMIAALAYALRNHLYHPRSRPMLEEANYYAYVTDDAGRSRGMSAPAGFHDDLIIAHSIAIHLLSQPDSVDHAFAYLGRMQELVQARVVEAEVARTFPGQHVAPGTLVASFASGGREQRKLPEPVNAVKDAPAVVDATPPPAAPAPVPVPIVVPVLLVPLETAQAWALEQMRRLAVK